MKLQLTNKFLHRVRIHGGEFDSSARAMNRAEESNFFQAELRKFRGSTFERKQMSTTIKRVALVAVAALGLGVMSVAPSQAAAQLDSVTVSAASTTQQTTETLTATAVTATATLAGTMGVDTLTVTASIVTGPAYIQPVLSLTETTAALATGSGSSAIAVSPLNAGSVTQATAKFKLYLNAPSVAGTYVVKLTPTGGVNAVATTVSIVVSTIAIQGPNAANSEVWLSVSDTMVASNEYGSWVQGSVGERYSALFVNSGAGYAAGGLVPLNAVDTRTIGVLTAGTLIGSGAWKMFGANNSVPATRSPVTFTISGPAALAFQTDASSPYSKQYSNTSVTESKLGTVGTDPYDPASQSGSFFLYSTGGGGVVKVTATMGGVELGSRTFSIIGTATAYVFGTPTKTVIGVTETASVAITGTDSYGTSTGAASVYAFSSDTSVATVASAQGSSVVITGVKSGTATISVGNASTLAASTITKTLAVKVGAVTAKTVTFTFDNNSPQPGEKVTMTVTALDASGNAVGDGPRALFTSAGITTGLQVQGATWTATETVTVKDGKATYSFYAPTGTGSLTVSATEGTATDSTTKGSIAGTVTVNNASADAAVDAANEAAQAASDATDAALAAADAADAATAAAQDAVDAVAALSAEVNTLIKALKAQITTLTNLVIKIQKKVKA